MTLLEALKSLDQDTVLGAPAHSNKTVSAWLDFLDGDGSLVETVEILDGKIYYATESGDIYDVTLPIYWTIGE